MMYEPHPSMLSACTQGVEAAVQAAAGPDSIADQTAAMEPEREAGMQAAIGDESGRPEVLVQQETAAAAKVVDAIMVKPAEAGPAEAPVTKLTAQQACRGHLVKIFCK